MRILKYMLLFCIPILILPECKEVYNPPSIQNNPQLLVIDGIVISGNDSTLITLSRTKALTDSAPSINEMNARVSVVGVSGVEYLFADQGNGRYVTDHLLLDTTQPYQLKIITKDGNEFRSALSNVRPSPPIDSVYWIQDSAGEHIYLNTHDPANNTRYYRWENTETWEYLSAYDSYLDYFDENNIIFRGLPDQIYRCYQTQLLPYIEVVSTSRLSSDIVNKYEVIEIPTGSEKLGAFYSDLIKQYAISLEAFNYWTNLKKNTEQLGSLFDLQPFTELGNVQCVNNPNAKCVGYISFSTVQKQRIFINYTNIFDWNYKPYYNAYEPCFIQKAFPQDISKFFLPPGGPYGNSLIGQGIDPPFPSYLFSTILCVDCRVHGGTAVKPSFWP